jgi:hypothetical protein
MLLGGLPQRDADRRAPAFGDREGGGIRPLSRRG